MNYDPPPEDPLVKAQRLAAERDSIKTQQSTLGKDTQRLMRVYGGKSLFSATDSGRAMINQDFGGATA